MVRKCLDGIFCMLFLCGVAGMLLFLLPHFFQLSPRVVLSGSMEPEIPVGSMAYISRAVPPEDICENDVIAYRMGTSTDILHRVVRVDARQQIFQTKGDANRNVDLGQVKFAQYEGREVFSIPYVGYLVSLLRRGYTIPLLAAAIVLLVLADRAGRKKERRKSE